jgi:hypothetical protein
MYKFTVTFTEVTFESEALFALQGHCGLRRGQGLPPRSPRPFLR